jgi:hypothetical protein
MATTNIALAAAGWQASTLTGGPRNFLVLNAGDAPVMIAALTGAPAASFLGQTVQPGETLGLTILSGETLYYRGPARTPQIVLVITEIKSAS